MDSEQVVEALKKECRKVKLAPSDPVEDDPVDAVLRLELLQNDTKYIAIVIYDAAKRLMSAQIARREDEGEGMLADDGVASRMYLPKKEGQRLERALAEFASSIASSLALSELYDEEGDDDEEESEDEDDGSDEEEEGSEPYPDPEKPWSPESEAEWR